MFQSLFIALVWPNAVAGITLSSPPAGSGWEFTRHVTRWYKGDSMNVGDTAVVPGRVQDRHLLTDARHAVPHTTSFHHWQKCFKQNLFDFHCTLNSYLGSELCIKPAATTYGSKSQLSSRSGSVFFLSAKQTVKCHSTSARDHVAGIKSEKNRYFCHIIFGSQNLWLYGIIIIILPLNFPDHTF